jgi:hypothetical protein
MLVDAYPSMLADACLSILAEVLHASGLVALFASPSHAQPDPYTLSPKPGLTC